MTLEAAQFLAKAQKFLPGVAALLGVALNDAADRSAYLAGFHAGQAFNLEKIRTDG